MSCSVSLSAQVPAFSHNKYSSDLQIKDSPFTFSRVDFTLWISVWGYLHRSHVYFWGWFVAHYWCVPKKPRIKMPLNCQWWMTSVVSFSFWLDQFVDYFLCSSRSSMYVKLLLLSRAALPYTSKWHWSAHRMFVSVVLFIQPWFTKPAESAICLENWKCVSCVSGWCTGVPE